MTAAGLAATVGYALEALVYLVVAVYLWHEVQQNHYHHRQFRPLVAALAAVCSAEALEDIWRVVIRVCYCSSGNPRLDNLLWPVLSIASTLCVLKFYAAFRISRPVMKSVEGGGVPVNPATGEQQIPQHTYGELKRGSRGAAVRALQAWLGVEQTCEFDDATEKAVIKYQRSHLLPDHGRVDDQLYRKITGLERR